MQREQAVRRGGVDDVLPQHAGADAGDPVAPASISTPPMPGGLDEHRAAQVAERAGVVAGRLARDAQARGARAQRTTSATSLASAG